MESAPKSSFPRAALVTSDGHKIPEGEANNADTGEADNADGGETNNAEVNCKVNTEILLHWSPLIRSTFCQRKFDN